MIRIILLIAAFIISPTQAMSDDVRQAVEDALTRRRDRVVKPEEKKAVELAQTIKNYGKK